MPVGYSSFHTPAGNLAPTINGVNFDARFANTATFTGTCSQGEYRQYVKGEFTANGSVVTHVLCGPVKLLPGTYLEDGCPSPGCTAYGHRNCPNSLYTPGRADGCNFSMYDAPGFQNVVQGSTYSVNLSFQGNLVDISKSGSILVAKEWTVQGATKVTDMAAMATLPVLASTDRIIGAHTTLNTETQIPELHIVITRPRGLLGIDGTSIKSTLIDAGGRRSRPAGPPAVHEVGTQNQATVSLVFTLEATAPLPTTVELAVQAGVITLQVTRLGG